MRTTKKLLRLALICLACLSVALPALAVDESKNPLVDPKPVTEYTKTEKEYLNILLAGIDYYGGSLGPGGSVKNKLAACHTDAVLVASVNLTDKQINLISIPRDTLVYVPGVHGIYKINAAMNCADTVDEGLMHTCDAASWLLGGVEINKYIAVTLGATVALGDVMGGVELESEMAYTGTFGGRYAKGLQHLDGMGMMEYARARKNATVDSGKDMGRTRRQRTLATAVYKKLRQNPSLVNDLWAKAFSGDVDFFTNLEGGDLASLLPVFMELDPENVGNYVLTGTYQLALRDWNFTFTDQAARQEMIKAAFGLDVEKLPYVDHAYTSWLMDYGFPVSRQIHIARQIIDYAHSLSSLTSAQEKALEALELSYNAAVKAFDEAADQRTDAANKALTSARIDLRSKGEAAAAKFNFNRDASWNTGMYWYRDPLINEYTEIDWR